MSESQVAEITLALREYYAAENSLKRAHKELSELIPPGMLLLHRKPGDADGPRTLYWSWEVGRIYGEEKSRLLNGVERWSDLEGRNVIIIEAPPPREEFLPRLDADCTDAARPSWWRGNDHGIGMICDLVNAILDGNDAVDDGIGIAGEPWESTRRRLLAMAALFGQGVERMSDRSVDDLAAGDRFRSGLRDRADAWAGPAPLWHGWALMDAYLAGLDAGRCQEREACAKIAEVAVPLDKWDGASYSHAAEEIAAAIRSRGE